MIEKKLGEICTLEKGIAPIQKTNPGIFPLVVTAEERLSADSYQFDGEYVCIPMVSSTGHGHASLKRIHYQTGKFSLGNILCAIRSKDESVLITKYLYIFLSFFKDELLVSLMKGSANVSLSVTDLINLVVPIPSVEVQNRIVQKYEHLIETNIEKITEQRKKYETKTKLLKELFINKVIDDSKLVRMDSVFDIQKGNLQSSKCIPGDFNFITAAAEWKTHITYEHEFEALIYAVGAEGSLGRVHYVNDKFITSDLCFILTSKKDIIYKLYQNIFLINREKMVHELATGTSKKAINYKNFSKHLIPWVDYEKQITLYEMVGKINEIESRIIRIKDREDALKTSYIRMILKENNLLF